ncbi:hypothetical protein V865_008214 [Kwoniella europaea PYCC6329]|uniref:Major facilitator superfamily (MFS) profile domain-containing protein n=1 Tax=Kwoniella europaea PYCC6329 TaxID=1423913 RepID=A0AAX4KUP6_9TREE
MSRPLHRRGNTDPRRTTTPTTPVPLSIQATHNRTFRKMRMNSPISPSRMKAKGQTPLPFAQIAVLMGVRLAEPIAYTVIFPFVNQMVEELGVTDNPDRIGFYSGLVESVFAFVQFFTVYHWAKLSDKIGRKPVILFGLIGVVVSGSLFGLATSFWMMIAFRCLSGALNGNVAVIRAAIGDITDSTNSTDAFAMYGLTWTVGAIVGNALGGSLSHPFERFPNLFGSLEILRTYPYLLPCLVTAGLTLIGILFCLIFYHESLPALVNNGKGSLSFLSLSTMSFNNNRKSHKRYQSSSSLISESETLVGDEESSSSSTSANILSKLPRGDDGPEPLFTPIRKNEWGFWELMGVKKVRVMAATAFLNAFVQGAWNAACLLFFFDRNNGLAMSASSIGTAFAINGLVTIVVQLVLLTRIKRLFGIAGGYKVLTIGWIFVWLLLPLLRLTKPPGGSGGWTLSIFVNVYLSFVTVINLTGSLLMVLINTASPDKSALGAINGIGTAVGCMARVIGPSLISALFAYSMETRFMNGRAWWIFMVLMSIINLIVSFLVDNEQEHPKTHEEEELAMGLLEDNEDRNDYDDELTPVERSDTARELPR